jgi:hypothetical protein
MLRDRLFHRGGSLYYPKVVNGPKEQEFCGDMNCVNGKVMPFLEVEPRKYLFRILNASNSLLRNELRPSDANRHLKKFHLRKYFLARNSFNYVIAIINHFIFG